VQLQPKQILIKPVPALNFKLHSASFDSMAPTLGVSAAGASSILATLYEEGDAVEMFWGGYDGVYPGKIIKVYTADKLFIIEDEEENKNGLFETTTVAFDDIEKHQLKALPSTLARLASSAGLGTVRTRADATIREVSLLCPRLTSPKCTGDAYGRRRRRRRRQIRRRRCA
jgi:hypothetical protein